MQGSHIYKIYNSIMKKIIQLSIFLTIATSAFTQVQFEVEWLESSEEYMVSLVSAETWAPPSNITSTAQVSIKVPAEGFELSNLVNLQQDVVFELNGMHESPDESPDFDYISFGLTTIGTHGLSYEEGEKVGLFTFKNSGECAGPIHLLGGNDPFMPPNSQSANIGNQITVLGAQGDAYQGNVGSGKADCSLVSSTRLELDESSYQMFPNPVKDQLNLELTWEQNGQEVDLVIYDLQGKTVMTETVTFVKGDNSHRLNIEKIPSGTYSLEIQTGTEKVALDQFMKL